MESARSRVDHIETRPSFSVVLNTFKEQAKKPPGGDASIASCYRAVTSLTNSEPDFESFLRFTYEGRLSMTPSHFVNLFFRAVQYIKMYEHGDFDYVDYRSEVQWEPELRRLVSENRDKLEEILLNKDTATTVYQRYAGPKALIVALTDGSELRIADFGCGVNYGLRGFELNEPFEPIEDGVPGRSLREWLEQPLALAEGLAVDKVNPEDPEVKSWMMACSFYPKELANVENVKEMEERLKKSKKVRFLQEDLTSPSNLIAENYFDAVILSTILYQHSPEDRLVILAEARRIVKPRGSVIVQDFARVDSTEKCGLRFENAWFNNHRYRTFISASNKLGHFLEIFQWVDGRCHKVRPGADYSKIFSNPT